MPPRLPISSLRKGLAAVTAIGLIGAAAMFGTVTADAATTQTGSCVDGGGVRWKAKAIWGGTYTSGGVRKISINYAGWTTKGRIVPTDSYVRTYSGDGTRIQKLTWSGRYNYKAGTAYRVRNPLNPASDPGRAKVKITLGVDGDGHGNCSVTFTQPGGSTAGEGRPSETTPPPPPTTDRTGFPTPSNTGIPDGTSLARYAGPCTIREQGTVIDAKLIECSPLQIDTTGVRITRSRVTGGIYSGRGESDGPMKVTVERSELVGNDTWRGISDSDYVVRDSYIHGGYSGGYCHRNCVVEGNYIEGSGGHASGFRLLRNAVFRGNTLWCKRVTSEADGGCSSDLTMYQEFGIVTNVLVEGNLFKATPGWFCARAGNVGSGNQPGNHTYVRFINNVFERGAGNCSEQPNGSAVADFDASREGNQWTGNTYVGGGAVPSS